MPGCLILKIPMPIICSTHTNITT
ncbi:hypothetical protein VTL71DRAFT_5850 [Oculimacula yallundae]|uniref:NADH dehydrogenase subunit 1 n=1 Tax=Oculimacula yallundae TaxID=86028 RepID=A0ABR4BYP7_9HELO